MRDDRDAALLEVVDARSRSRRRRRARPRRARPAVRRRRRRDRVPRRRGHPSATARTGAVRRERRRHAAGARPGPPRRRRRFVHVSSNSPFGANPTARRRFTEDVAVRTRTSATGSRSSRPSSSCSASTTAATSPTVIVRPPWFYGPFQPDRQTQFFRGVRRGRFPLVGTGTQRRSMVYTGNLVHGLLLRRGRWPPRAGPGVLDRRRRALRAARRSCRPSREALEAEGLPVTSRVAAPRARRGRSRRGSARRAASRAAGATCRRCTSSASCKDTIACDISRRARRARLRARGGAARRHAGQHPVVPRAGRSALMARRILVTGGSGYFGTVLVDRAGRAGRPRPRLRRQPARDSRRRCGRVRRGRRPRPGDVARRACDGVDVVLHNVAQVPLAKDRELFRVRERRRHREPARRRARRRRRQGRAHVVERGVRHPGAQPGHRGHAVPSARGVRPGQARGRGAVPRGGRRRARRDDHPAPHDPRPRPARHHGDPLRVRRRRRAGVRARRRRATATSSSTPTTSPTPACAPPTVPVRPSTTSAPAEFGTMRETLQALVDHAGTGSRVRSLPVGAGAARDAGARPGSGSAPFAPYHWLLYGESLWFDMTQGARPSSDWEPAHSNASMVIESYEWFLAHRDELGATRRLAPPVARPARRPRRPEAAAVSARSDDAVVVTPGRVPGRRIRRRRRGRRRRAGRRSDSGATTRDGVATARRRGAAVGSIGAALLAVLPRCHSWSRWSRSAHRAGTRCSTWPDRAAGARRRSSHPPLIGLAGRIGTLGADRAATRAR